MRLLIAPDKKFTLQFLAAGQSYESLQYQFRIHCTRIGRFVLLPRKVINNYLKGKYLKTPRTDKELSSVADVTFDCWQFLNAIGTMNEKYVSLFLSNGSGSEYHNYKGFFSLAMLARDDYDYELIFIDVECQGRISDRSDCNNSSLRNAIKNNL